MSFGVVALLSDHKHHHLFGGKVKPFMSANPLFLAPGKKHTPSPNELNLSDALSKKNISKPVSAFLGF